MATVTFNYPVKEMHGAVSPGDNVYVRTVNGKTILQHKPQMKSEKRIAACKAFGEKYGTARKK